MIYNRIPVVFGNLRKITIPPVSFQYDIVQKLIISGLELPEYYQVDFCNDGDTSTITMVGTADGVDIPDQFLQTGRTVVAYLVINGTDTGAVETRYQITIPVNKRPTRTDIEPTPEEQGTIDSLIAAMNDAVDDAEASATAAEGFAENAEASAERAEQAAQSIDDKVERAEAAAQAAGVSATRAEDAAEDALAYKNDAAQSAGSASSSAEDARNSKETAIEKAAEAEQSAAQAAESAASAEGDAQEAEQAAQQATQAASAAEQSATAAQGSATAASGSATVATDKAAEASESATIASGKATEASNSAISAQTAQTGAENAQAAAEAAQQVAEEAAQEAQTILVDKAPVITDTASGAIATFPDGAENLPLKKLVAPLAPVQDLHGYDSPWPAGGGKNKIDEVGIENVFSSTRYCKFENGIFHFLNDGSGICFSKTVNITLQPGTYTLSAPNYRKTSGATPIWRVAIGSASQTYPSMSNPYTFTVSEASTVSIYFTTNSQNTASEFYCNVQLESGSTATSYAPYSNLCPISGWTGLEGKRTGVNVWDEQTTKGYINSTTGVVSKNQGANTLITDNYISVKPETQYIVATTASTLTANVRTRFYDINKEYLGYKDYSGSPVNYNQAFKTPAKCAFLMIEIPNQYGTTYNHDISINYPSTDTSYHAYTGETLSVSWQDTAGTVYGGSMTVNEDGSGVLVAEWCKKHLVANDFTAFLATYKQAYADNLLSSAPAKYYASETTYLCDSFKPVPNTNRGENVGNFSSLISSGNSVAFSSPSNTLEEFKALIPNGIDFVYELATPLTYTFDNLEQLTTLFGTNNIWVDTGDVEVEYRADTKLYLEKLTAPTEDDMIANANIAANKFFMVGNNLYLSTAAIAQGATIVPGTNCTLTNLADALNTLNS